MPRRIRVGDTVVVKSGADRGKQGKVIAIRDDRVRVDGVRIQKVHLKPGRKAARGGGILEREGYIHASNVMLVDSQGGASRVRHERDEGGRSVRVFAKSGERIPEPVGS